MKEDLWDLRHARDGFTGEVVQMSLCPSGLIGIREVATVWCAGEEIKGGLEIGFHARDTAGQEERVEVVKHGVNIGGIYSEDCAGGY